MKQFLIHYLQHVAFEGLGCIETWAKNNGHSLSSTKFFEEDTLPGLNDFDWLIIMGGPMGVYEENQYPWIKAEREFILKAIEARKTVIGICLGSQLIASALGAKVYPGKKKEIGWFSLTKTKEGKKNSLLSEIPEEFISFHWHGDSFELPDKAVNLLESEACINQSFLYGDKVLGLQFHLEVTPDALSLMTENGRHELIEDDFIQNENEILNQAHHCNASNEYLIAILSKLSD
ncbi:MAG: type 1 glutamine amidotransferase [Balneolales bacterium]|nr:type 1 glutamine amidotransferase [Balneolales bacterium]